MKTQSVVCLLVGLVVCFSASSAFAEEEKKNENSLKKGAWAMQFEVIGSLLDFQVSDYLGETFSGKYHIADRRALRIGIDLHGSMSDINTDRENIASLAVSKSENDDMNVTHSVQIIMHHLWYLRESNDFFLVGGIGPMLNISRQEIEHKGVLNYVNDVQRIETATSIRESNSYYLGLSGALGLEYFVRKNIGLSLEFQSNIGYSYSVRDYESKLDDLQDPDDHYSNSDSRRTHQISYKSNRVKVGVSIYF